MIRYGFKAPDMTVTEFVEDVLKSADVRENVRGEWFDDVAYYDEEGCPCIVTRCNQCGEVSPVSNFCPNCGADMRGNADETD